MHDFFEKDLEIFEMIENKARQIASYYGFKPVSTPVVEKADLFIKSEDEDNPLVEKEMYAFRTRGGDHLALRPEGTPPIIRAYFEDGLQSWPQPVALYYSGTYYRHESPQRGRYREFRQFGLEFLGEPEAISDALVVNVFNIIFKELGIKSFIFHINTLGDKECRKSHRRDLLNFLKRKKERLCKECKKRSLINPLRFFDCKEPDCEELKKEAPLMINYLCDGCKAHFKNLVEILDELEIPYYLNNNLVRGLDYYSRTVFETFIEKDAKEEKPAEYSLSVCSGGRYDYLSEMLGFRPLNAVGGAIGIERLAWHIGRKEEKKETEVFLAQLGNEAKRKGLKIFEELRKAKIAASQSFTKDSLKAQLATADGLGAYFTAILGQREIIDGTAMIRDMKTGAQETVPQDKLIEYLKSKLKEK